MYFQQIFWCVYDKGSDLAGDMPFLKGKIICGLEHWRKQLFPQKWRQEGGKREKKKEARAGGRSQGAAMAFRFSQLEVSKVCLLFMPEL